MRRILIWRKVVPGNELDIFGKTDYKIIYRQCAEFFGEGCCPNWGNKLWFQGLYSEIDNGENMISFRTDETPEEINSQFDLIIYPMANFFSVEYISSMEELAAVFAPIKIPVYVIACGAQADDYGDLDRLVHAIGEPAKRFISAIYQTGGEFALRGDFTKAFFDTLGFSTAVVTGCPSMYQLGAKFRMNNEKLNTEQLLPVVNGRLQYVKEILKQYPHSVYIDQDRYFRCLFDPDFNDGGSIHSQIVFHYNFDAYSAQLLAENRIKMIADMNNWYTYLQRMGFNYSIGSRIHGSIMAILSGIPATVLAVDTRTQEMAEFFDIPCVKLPKGKPLSVNRMKELYLAADYTKFNQSYETKYQKYVEFLKQHGIVSKMNEENAFFSNPDERLNFETETVNQEKFKKLSRDLKLRKPVLELGCILMDVKNSTKNLS